MYSAEALHEAFLRIKHDPQLQPFVEWLKAEREKARDRLETTPSEQAQGRALQLKEILNLIEQASAVLEKVRARR